MDIADFLFKLFFTAVALIVICLVYALCTKFDYDKDAHPYMYRLDRAMLFLLICSLSLAGLIIIFAVFYGIWAT